MDRAKSWAENQAGNGVENGCGGGVAANIGGGLEEDPLGGCSAVLSMFCHSVLTTHPRVGTSIIGPILQTQKWRHR